MKCSWKWLWWWGTYKTYVCRWGLKIHLCLQESLGIHLYPKDKTKDNAKTRFGQHQPISLASPFSVFYKSWKQTCLSTSSNASFCQGAAGAGCPARQGEPGTMGGSRADKDRDLLHSTPSHSGQKKWLGNVWWQWPGSAQSPVMASKVLTEAGPRTSQDARSGPTGWEARSRLSCSLAQARTWQGAPGPAGRAYLSWTSRLVGCYCSLAQGLLESVMALQWE